MAFRLSLIVDGCLSIIRIGSELTLSTLRMDTEARVDDDYGYTNANSTVQSDVGRHFGNRVDD